MIICSQLLLLTILHVGVTALLALPTRYLWVWLKVMLLVEASRAVLPGGVLVDDSTIYVLVQGASIVSV